MSHLNPYKKPKPPIDVNKLFIYALSLILITLKLTNHIDWSWWWVLCPIWAAWVAYFGTLLGTFLFLIGCEYYKERKLKKLRAKAEEERKERIRQHNREFRLPEDTGLGDPNRDYKE